MICKNCPEGRRFARGSIECLLYGIIINENHKCTREGGKRHDRDESDGQTVREEAELQKDSRGTA